MIAVLAPPASAEVIHSPTGDSFGPDGASGLKSFANVQSIAIDSSIGTIYVYDGGVGNLYKFDTAGEPSPFASLGKNVIEGIFAGRGAEIAVAPEGSLGGTAHDVYVAPSETENGVRIFSAEGEELPDLNVGPRTFGVATDSEGRLFTGSKNPTTYREFVPSSNPVSEADKSSVENTPPSSFGLSNIAADGLGNVYGATAGQIYKLEGLSDLEPTLLAGGGATLAINFADNNVYADEGERVAQYAPSGYLRGTFGSPQLSSSVGVAVDPDSGEVYVDNGGKGKVEIFGPQEVIPQPPLISAAAATGVSGTSATLTARVDPGDATTTYHVEYLTDAQFSSEGGFASPQTIRTSETPLGTSEEAETVSVPVSGLIPGTTYRFRFVVTNDSPGDPVVRSPDRTFLTVGPGGEAGEACPNEAVRSEGGSSLLPDCRAYERVTPAIKNGAEVQSKTPIYVGDGPRLAFESFAAFGRPESSTYIGSSVEFARLAAGWTTRAVNAPGSRFEGTDRVTPLYALGSDDRNLLGLRPRNSPADAESLYVRQADSITEIGPEAPPSSLIGRPSQENISANNNGYFKLVTSTADLSHVVFQLGSAEYPHNYLWPFDQTTEGSNSAYEYVGTEQKQPFLVGVTGGPGSSQLVGGCGTWIGSFPGGDIYNAVSRDGRTIFFTPVGEDNTGPCSSPAGSPSVTGLYARIDGEGAGAHTVSISEPGVADCSACQTSSPQYAEFQGASEDGSKVFFLTEQELLPGNPGKNLYEYDFRAPAGQRVTDVSHLASGDPAGVLGVVRVSEDGSHVYFVATSILTSAANSTGAVARVGEPNLYAYDTTSGSTKFVATLAETDSATWSTLDMKRQAEATPDGRFLLFTSTAALTPDNTSSASQLFRYDAATGGLTRISVGQGGFNDNGNTSVDPVTIPERVVNYAEQINGPASKLMSDDGSFIFFESTIGLTPKALDHAELPNHVGFFAENVYEWHEGKISLITDGRDRTYVGAGAITDQNSSVRLLGTDSHGEDVLFTTASPLVPTDTDSGQEIYDARIGGGFPGAGGNLCEGEGCQGRSVSPAGTQTAGSQSFVGPENPKHHKHHKKKHHKHHKKKHDDKKHHNGSGHANRGDQR